MGAGHVSGAFSYRPEFNLSAADFAFVGEFADDHAGCSVSSAGDIDGDGLDDILVGAYSNDDGGSDGGKAYVVLGSSLWMATEIDLSAADHAFVGEDSNDNAGIAVSNAGDLDGNGLDDLLIGAQGNDDAGSSVGKVYILLGAP